MINEIDGSVTSSAWYYATDGIRTGPLAQQEIENAISAGLLDAATPVWRPGMTEWIPLAKSSLAALIVKAAPPPLPGAVAGNSIAWLLALAPLLGTLLEIAVALVTSEGGAQEASLKLNTDISWVITAAMTILLAAWDEQRLKKAGIVVAKIRLVILLVPLYLYARAGAAKRGYIYVFVWLLSFAAAIACHAALGENIQPASYKSPRALGLAGEGSAVQQSAEVLGGASAPLTGSDFSPETKTYGKIRIESKGGEHIVKNGRRVLAKFESLFVNQVEKWDGVESSFQLFLIGSGGTACPATFFVVETTPDGDVVASPEFGTCSDNVRVWQAEDVQFFDLPGEQGGKVTFAYRHGEMTCDGKALN